MAKAKFCSLEQCYNHTNCAFEGSADNPPCAKLVEEKFTSTNTASPKCLCPSCSRLLSNGGTCEPNTNSHVTTCGGYSGTSGEVNRMKDEVLIKKQWLDDCVNDPEGYYDLNGDELQSTYGFWKSGWMAAYKYTNEYPDADGDDADSVCDAWKNGFYAACIYLNKCKGGA